MSVKNTQLTQVENYDTTKLTFSKVQEFPIPNNDAGLVYRRVSIGTENPDGTKGDLVIKTPRCFSFGLSENVNDNTGLVDGYSVPLCLKSRDGWAIGEKEFYDGFLAIIEAIKQHCLKDEVKEDLGKFDMVYTDLRKLDPIYRKKDKKGRLVEDAGPVLYPKALMNKKTGNMMTTFYEEGKFDETGEPREIEYRDMISNKVTKNYCYVTAALKIESIYVGQNLSLQVKIIEADVERMNNQKTSLLRTSRPVVNAPQNILIEQKDSVDSDSESDSDSENDGKGETNGNGKKLEVSDSESEPEPEPETKTKTPTKVVKKKVVKKKAAKKST